MGRFTDGEIVQRSAAIAAIMVTYSQVQMVEAALHDRILMGVGGHSARLALLLAESGCGKTTAIESFTSKTNADPAYAGVPRPVLKVRLPAPCNIKSMTTTLLDGLGDPLAHQTSTIPRNTSRIVQQLGNQGVRLMIIDEFQHLSENRKANPAELTDWLKVLLDAARIPVCCVGLPTALAVVMSNTQLARRTSRVISMRPFRFDTSQEQGEYRAFLHLYEKAMPFTEASSLSSPELSRMMFEASGGLPGNVAQIIAEASMVSMRRAEGPDCLTRDDLARAYSDLPFPAVNPFDKDVVAAHSLPDVPALSNRVGRRASRH